MSHNPLKCSITLVFSVLKDNVGIFLSVREINRNLFENYNTNMTIETIVCAIDKLKVVNPNIKEREERRGIKRIPVKVFSLIQNEPTIIKDNHTAISDDEF